MNEISHSPISLEAETCRTTLQWVTAIDPLPEGLSGHTEPNVWKQAHCTAVLSASWLPVVYYWGDQRNCYWRKGRISLMSLDNPLTSVFPPFWKTSQGLSKPCMSKAALSCRLAMRNVRAAHPQTQEPGPGCLLCSLHLAHLAVNWLAAKLYQVFLPTYCQFISQ